MKKNMGIFMALAIFYILVAVLALIMLGGKNSFFNKGKNTYGAEPAVLSQTVIGENSDNRVVEESAPVVVSEPEVIEEIQDDGEEIIEDVETEPEIEEEIEIEDEPVEEPVVYEKRYLSFTTTNDEPLRFRKGPSEDAEIITKLFTGTLGYVTQPGNEWCKVVMTTGREGYLATEFLGMKELTEEEYPERFKDLVEAPQEELTELKFIEVPDDDTQDTGSEE